jgi:U3 small nucleolar RNA-associated protein 10
MVFKFFLVSGNPQTFHQALLLIANLARLAPDSVLHNVMPVFTFMGSNVFHRDDSYSFKVVQQVLVDSYLS